MRSFVRVLAAALVLAPALALGQVTTWSIDPVHSHAGFSVRHMVVSNVRGDFSKVTGTVLLDEKDPTKSTVEASIDASTIDTREPKRDADLRSPNFLDVAKYPTITFKSTRVERAGEGLKVTGDLTIHGVTRSVVLDVQGPTAAVKDPWGNVRRGASATTRIDRKDFGVAYSAVLEGGGAVVGNELAIQIDAELVKK